MKEPKDVVSVASDVVIEEINKETLPKEAKRALLEALLEDIIPDRGIRIRWGIFKLKFSKRRIISTLLNLVRW